jgi:hypothetical protein
LKGLAARAIGATTIDNRQSTIDNRRETMKGLIGKAVAALGFAGLLVGANGCHCYNEVVDPCYPERYWSASRDSVNKAFAAQITNGNILEQTVWNYHFEAGSDRLAPGGLERLASLARKRPHPYPVIYLQTAGDIEYNPAKPDELPKQRGDLDRKRADAIQKYLAAQTAGGAPTVFSVQVHNPPDPGQAAIPAAVAIVNVYTSARGTLPGGGGATVTGGAGATGGR